jgi:hypothetical protein
MTQGDYKLKKQQRTAYHLKANRQKWSKYERINWFRRRWNTQTVIDTLEYKLFHWNR